MVSILSLVAAVVLIPAFVAIIFGAATARAAATAGRPVVLGVHSSVLFPRSGGTA
jgi:hypothetical protein